MDHRSDGVNLSRDEKELLRLLKALPGQSIDDESLSDKLAIGKPSVFGLAADLVQCQLAFLRELLSGIEAAQRRMGGSPAVSWLSSE